MDKKDKLNTDITEGPNRHSWKASSHEISEEELEKINNLNWEWYYNCYLYIDEITFLPCRRCAHINIFQPMEKERICDNCGAQVKRCAKEE